MRPDPSTAKHVTGCKGAKSKASKQAANASRTSASVHSGAYRAEPRAARLLDSTLSIARAPGESAVRKVCVQTKSGLGMRCYRDDRVARHFSPDLSGPRGKRPRSDELSAHHPVRP